MEFCRFLFFSSLWLVPAVTAFSHPGLLVTDQDISRATKKIAAKQDPWLSSWEKLTSLEYSSASYANGAVADVSRQTNGELLWHDAAAAFNLALRWKISGNETYADTAAAVLVAWAENLQVISGGDEGYLMAGLQGYQLANAAELLRDYSPFAEAGLSTVTTMLTTIFLPMNLDFLNQVLGSQHNVLHFFANWELCNIASAMAIGVLTDNQTTWDFTVDYFKNGVGNGNINHAVSNIVEEPDTGNPLGQGQESGRDQGHSALDFQLLGVIGQQAWNQGVDLFAYNNSRILLGAEYFARYNLGHDVPFEPYTNGIVSYTTISDDSRGAIRPTWELLYAHYVQVKGLDAPWTTEYLNNTLEYFGGFEGGAGSWGEGSGHYDGLGWGSLLYHLDESDLEDLTSSASAVASSTMAASTESTSAEATTTDTTVSSGASSTQLASDAAVSTIVPSSTTVTDVPISTTVLATPTDSSDSALSSSTQTATPSSDRSPTGKNGHGKPCRHRRR